MKQFLASENEGLADRIQQTDAQAEVNSVLLRKLLKMFSPAQPQAADGAEVIDLDDRRQNKSRGA